MHCSMPISDLHVFVLSAFTLLIIAAHVYFHIIFARSTNGVFTLWQLFTEPTLRTNKPQKKMLRSSPPDEKLHEPEGTGVPLRKGDEVCMRFRSICVN